MLKLTLMDKHSGGCHCLDIFRNEHNEICMSVFEKSGGPQFDFDLDESDLEILSVMIDRARQVKAQEGSGDEH